MKEIVFATNNTHKLEEIRAILGSEIRVLSLSDIHCTEDIPEPFDSLEMNAHSKAAYILLKYGYPCFADDTGLLVDALGGEPGVRSARYAEGTDHDSRANMNKLLTKLGNSTNRRACFRTVLVYAEKGDMGGNRTTRFWEFKGEVQGDIAMMPRGKGGFGYDPVFVPEGYNASFAELGAEVKNNISHRAKAVHKLAAFLQSYLP